VSPPSTVPPGSTGSTRDHFETSPRSVSDIEPQSPQRGPLREIVRHSAAERRAAMRPVARPSRLRRDLSSAGRATRWLLALVAVAPALLAAPAAHASGSLELTPDLPILVVLVIGFAVLIYPLHVLLFRPVFRVLDERRERIDGARARAEKLESDARRTLERYQGSIREVREESERARRGRLDEARAEQARIASEARGEAESEVERARRSLAESLEGARASLRQSAEELSRQAAERILGRSLS
jgi:F-type H+-transporting ATPase subunit b